MVCSAERNSRSTCAYTNSVLKKLNGWSFPEERSLEMTTSDTTLYNKNNEIEQGNYSNYIPVASVGEHRRAYSEKNAFFEVGDRAARYCGGSDSARSSWGLPGKGSRLPVGAVGRSKVRHVLLFDIPRGRSIAVTLFCPGSARQRGEEGRCQL